MTSTRPVVSWWQIVVPLVSCVSLYAYPPAKPPAVPMMAQPTPSRNARTAATVLLTRREAQVANNYTPQTWAVAVLQRLGYQPSRGAVQSLVGWARAEGGHWNNQARYNPLNTTQPEPGAGNTGSQGNIKVYRDWNQGIDATVTTLRNGRYGQILSGLRSGDPARVADAIGQTPWGTSGDLVRRTILGTKVSHIPSGGGGGSTPAPSSTTTTTSTTPGVDNSSLRRQLVAGFLAQGGVKNTEATATFAAAYRNAQDVPGVASTTRTRVPSPSSSPSTGGSESGISPHARPGDPVVSSKQSKGGLHQTDGLAGYPAHDFFAPAGSHAVAPVSGRVVRLSGHDPANGPTNGPHGPLGWSVYIQGDDGREYFLTHMGSRNVKAGQKVQQGQVIGTVADYDRYGTPSHIHMGVNG